MYFCTATTNQFGFFDTTFDICHATKVFDFFQYAFIIRILIVIEDLVLENGSDFLKIYNKDSDVIVSLTGKTKLKRIFSNDDTCLVEFTSDNTVSAKGFSVEVRQFESGM